MKRILLLCLTVLLTVTMVPVCAATVDINECPSVTVSEDGQVLPQPAASIGYTAIAAFATKYFYDLNSQPFLWYAEDVVTVRLNLTTTATVAIGYRVNGVTTIVQTITSQTPTCMFEIPTSGEYTVVVQNKTASGIYISSGSITG